MPKPIDKLSERELTALYHKRLAAHMRIVDRLIAAGRGMERGSEIRQHSDPDSVAWGVTADSFQLAADETRARERWHGSRKPIKRAK